jgi:hypothetical protein
VLVHAAGNELRCFLALHAFPNPVICRHSRNAWRAR